MSMRVDLADLEEVTFENPLGGAELAQVAASLSEKVALTALTISLQQLPASDVRHIGTLLDNKPFLARINVSFAHLTRSVAEMFYPTFESITHLCLRVQTDKGALPQLLAHLKSRLMEFSLHASPKTDATVKKIVKIASFKRLQKFTLILDAWTANRLELLKCGLIRSKALTDLKIEGSVTKRIPEKNLLDFGRVIRDLPCLQNVTVPAAMRTEGFVDLFTHRMIEIFPKGSARKSITAKPKRKLKTIDVDAATCKARRMAKTEGAYPGALIPPKPPPVRQLDQYHKKQFMEKIKHTQHSMKRSISRVISDDEIIEVIMNGATINNGSKPDEWSHFHKIIYNRIVVIVSTRNFSIITTFRETETPE